MDELFNALKTAYGKGSKYGVSDEAIGRVAALGATANLNEEQIAAFVAAAEPRFKEEQSEADKVRSSYAAKLKELEAAKAELEAKLNGNNPPAPKSNGGESEISKLVKLMQEQNEQMRKQNEALVARLDAMEGAKASELAVKSALEKFGGDAWVNGYPELRDSAWAQAIRIYERTGKSMTAEELHTEAMEIFKPLAKAKGLDISKPFQSDGGAGGDDADFSAFDKAAEKLGWTEPEKK